MVFPKYAVIRREECRKCAKCWLHSSRFVIWNWLLKIILDPWKFTIYLTDTRFLISLHWYLQVSFKFQCNLVRFHIKTYTTDPFWYCHTFLYAILTIILGGLLHKKLGSLVPLILQQFLQTRWKLPAKKGKIITIINPFALKKTKNQM